MENEKRPTETPGEGEIDGMTEVELLKREIALMKREKELLEKEKELLVREKDLQVSGNLFTSSEAANGSIASQECQSTFRMGGSEINAMIPEFDPSKGDVFLSDWIRNIENFKDVYGWDDRMLMFYGVLRLGGAAKLWYQSKKEHVKSWTALKDELRKSFPENKDDSTIIMQIMARRKKNDECVESYIYSVASLAAKINWPEETTLKYIISGLNDQNLKNVLVASNCNSINELLIKIKNYEEISQQNTHRAELVADTSRMLEMAGPSGVHRENTIRKRAYSNQQSHNFIRWHRGKEAMKRNRDDEARNLQPVDKRPRWIRTGTTPRCFRCNGEGHFATSCPREVKSRICYKCKKTGHIARDCQNVGYISNVNSLENEYHKNIRILDREIVSYLDLGSECSTIRDDIVRDLNLKICPSNKILRGFGGSEVKALGTIKEIIQLDTITRQIELAVVPNYSQMVPIIIGRNLLDRPDVKIIKTWGKFELVEVVEDKQNGDQTSSESSKMMDIAIVKEKPEFRLEDINVASEAPEKYKIILLDLINEHKYSFARDMSEIGKTNAVKMEITLRENKIINYKPYRIPYAQKPVIEKIIKDLIQYDIIQPSTSEYASPVLLVKKKNGDFRMCVDYRRLNAITKRETFPVPNIEETLNSLAGKHLFSKLDLLSGYHQIAVDEESRHLTAFVTPGGHYEYKRVPFGLTNAPAVFMRLMQKVLQPLQSSHIFYYLDDIIVANEDFDEHIDTLRRVFRAMGDEGVTLNLQKCHFLDNKLEFLGHAVSQEGIQPGSDKTKAIADYKEPTSAKEVRQFLGLAGYFRKFVKGYALIARPLNKLLRKDVTFKWTSETREAFKRLKSMLAERPILTLYKAEAEHEVHTDASSHGVAGILFQREQQTPLQPVAYYSRSTTPIESKYHSYELEALAVVESLERFKYYLLHKKFKIVTDCNSLKLTQEKKNLIPRIARWWLRISEFEYELEYRSGSKLAHVDALSRNPSKTGNTLDNVADKVMRITDKMEEDWLVSLQMQDKWIQEIRDVLENNRKDHSDFNGIKGNYLVNKRRVYKITQEGNRFFVPRGVRWRVIKAAHDDMGHHGIEKTLNKIKESFWFPSMKQVVTKYIKSCIPCLYHKKSGDDSHQVYVYERMSIPFHTVHVDFLGPFPKSKKGNVHVIGIVDSFSKLIVLKATRTTRTREVIRLLDEVTQYFGVPSRLVTDRGTAFTSREFQRYIDDNAIKHVLTAVQTPRANGQIERYFRTVRNAIATMSEDDGGRDWDVNLTAIQWSLNSLKHATTGKTPHEILMAFKPRSTLKNKLLLALHDTTDQDEENIPLSRLREIVRERIAHRQKLQADAYNEKSKQPKTYGEGDLVLIKQESVASGTPRKVVQKYKGPYEVKKVLPHDRYVIKDVEGMQLRQKAYESIHSADNMRAWCNLDDLNFDDELEDDESDDA